MTDKKGESNLVLMSEKSESCYHWTVDEMLKKALLDRESEEESGTKAVLLILYPNAKVQEHRIYKAGMNGPEVVSLMEIVKTITVKEMGHI